jgi:hypothetical protein
MLTVKRIAIFLIELLVEAFLLGGLLGIMVSHQIGQLNGMIGSIIAVPVILALHGYYILRILAVIARTSRLTWLYPSIATSVFIAHVWFVLLRSKADLSPIAQSMSAPFLIGGACIVFACAFAGTIALRKWAPARPVGQT